MAVTNYSLDNSNSENLSSEKIWHNVKDKLKNELGEATFNSWLKKLTIGSCSNGQLILLAPTRFVREWIITNYKESIKKSWREFDPSIVKIDIITAANKNETIANNYQPVEVITQTTQSNLLVNLDKRFTFDNFVVGQPNELAYAAARSVAESDEVKSELNPLFLYGDVGLGKTHLMHSIASHIHENNKDRKVLYLSAEKFMYRFIKALREKDIMQFKEYFRSVDVLMIDDVQFICGKENTQEEFFHTLNTLIDNNCQIVISADRSPSDLDGMEERIKSRLGWGLVVDIHSTTYELRLGILQAKAENSDIDIPKEVLEFLASTISSNVRELEGSLNKVIAHSKLINRPVTIENTKNILRDLIRSNEKIIKIADIQREASKHFNIKISDLTSARRMIKIARPRQIAMYLAKNLTTKSLVEIGRSFGGKDHTTVMHAIKTIEKLKIENIEIKEDIQIIKNNLQN